MMASFVGCARSFSFFMPKNMLNKMRLIGQLNLVLNSVQYRLIHQVGQIAELSKDDIDNMLRKNEKTVLVAKNAIHSFDTNQLPANSPCEDHHSEAVCVETGSWMFGVFDGHAGETCSRMVARQLFDYLSLCLMPRDKLASLATNFESGFLHWSSCSAGQESNKQLAHCHARHMRHFADYCANNSDIFNKNVRLAFETAFIALDDDLASNAYSCVNREISTEADFDPAEHIAVAETHLQAVLAGSCTCVAHVRGAHLHTANVGDSMGVLGVCTERGQWSARRLTKEHCIDNAQEAERVRSEHPVTESTTVLRAGRLLGQLYPLRAFGDVRYKWDARMLDDVFKNKSAIPPNLITPPYLTAKPDVFYHRLTPHDKFLVLASDGLWELLSPEAVVQIISDHMTGRQTLTNYAAPPGATYAEILAELRLRKQGEAKRPLDANAATHLIRCALGGGAAVGGSSSGCGVRQYRMLASTLGRPEGKKARSTRDDITIIVVYFDPVYLAAQIPA